MVSYQDGINNKNTTMQMVELIFILNLIYNKI